LLSKTNAKLILTKNEKTIVLKWLRNLVLRYKSNFLSIRCKIFKKDISLVHHHSTLNDSKNTCLKIILNFARCKRIMGKKEEQFNRRRLRLAYISAIISITLVLFILGLVGLTLISAQKLSNYVKESLSMELFLNDNITEAEANLLAASLKNKDFAKTVTYISKDKAKDTFVKLYGEDFNDFIDFNPLLASIQLNLKAEYVDSDKISVIESNLTSEYGDSIVEITKRID
jgi:hypothetical protein